MVIFSVLTDVEILPAWPELKSQWEGREELELFRELQWSIWGMRPITLPPLEPFGSVITGAVAIKVHHVQNIAFCLIFRHWVFIVRAEHIQVVVDADIDVIVTSLESEITEQFKHKHSCLRMTLLQGDILIWKGITNGTSFHSSHAHSLSKMTLTVHQSYQRLIMQECDHTAFWIKVLLYSFTK